MTVDRWRNANRRVFGHAIYLERSDPKEASAIRDAAQAVIDGRTPFDIARAWNARADLSTVSGARWYGQTCEMVLRRATNTAGPDPILTHEVFDAMLDRLNQPGRSASARSRNNYERVGAGRYVTSNVARCGMCGAPAQRIGSDNKTRALFGCRRRAVNGVFDRERHPTVDLVQSEEALVSAVVREMTSRLGTTAAEAAGRFDAMSLLEKRTLANEYFTVTVEPLPKRGGFLQIEPRPS